MNKIIVSAICGGLFFIGSYAQNKSAQELLNEIEENNIELKGYKSYIESAQLANKSGNNLPNPQFSGYYLPFGTNETGDYTEFEISQSFEFPAVYSARSKWNDLKSEQLETTFLKIRQEVLLKAKSYCIALTLLQKQKDIEVVRQEQGKKIVEQIEQLFAKEQVGILALNKAKIAWMQEQFVVAQIETEIQIILKGLEKLNGGKTIQFDLNSVEEYIEIPSMEALWQEKLITDPFIQELKANEAASLQKVALEKNKALPNLTAGYNYQGVSGNNNSGFYGGLSIPLWNSKNKVKAAQANYEYQQSNIDVVTATQYLNFQEYYNRYQLLFKKYNEYQTTLASLESEQLLFKAYMLGGFSFIEYYTELQFYRNAMDNMFQMEKELQLLKAQLLKHQL